MKETISKAEQLLVNLDNGEKVNRHSIFMHTSAIKILLEEKKYKHLTDKVYDLIESAKESY